MSLVAIVPVASLIAANTTLESAGFGARNFSVAAYAGPGATHAALHAWNDPAFAAAVKALPGVVWSEGTGDPIAMTQTLIAAQGAKWGAQAPALPTTGNATANTLYRFTDDTLWWCIQTFSRTTYGAHPSTYPALIRQIRPPTDRLPWKQPIDQFDAYRLVNAFTGQPDECTHAGKTWRTTRDNNVWQPGTSDSGWVEVAADGSVVVPQVETVPAWKQPTGSHDSYKTGDKVMFDGKVYASKINGNSWSPTAYPAGWTLTV